MHLNLRLAPAHGLQDTRVVCQIRAQMRVFVSGAAGDVEKRLAAFEQRTKAER